MAKALGYAKPNDAIARHCRATVKRSTPISGKLQDINFIAEGDLYRLICNSKLPTAEKFETWVFDEVLPSIRKHGAYMTPEVIEQTICNPDYIIKLATELKSEQLKRKELECKVEKQKPLVDFAEHIQQSETSIDMKLMAKLASKKGVNIGRNRLFEFLRHRDVLMKNNEPYQPYVENGWFEVVENTFITWGGEERITKTTLVKPKGQLGIVKMLKKYYM